MSLLGTRLGIIQLFNQRMDGCGAHVSGDFTHWEFRKLSCGDSGCVVARTRNQCWNQSFGDWLDDQNSLLKFRHITTSSQNRNDLSLTFQA